MNNKYLVGTLAVALLLGAYGTFRPAKVSETVKQEIIHEVATSPELGANGAPDSAFPYYSAGGARYWGAASGLKQATTTICTLTSPAATSTLVVAAIHMDVATTGGATTITFAKAVPGAFASTTIINGSPLTVGSGAEVNSTASTTALFPPNSNLNITQAGGGSATGQTFSETGTCTATWMQLAY